MSSEAEATMVTTQGTLAAGVAFSAGAAFSSLASPQSAFSMVNQFQLILLIPLITKYLPTDILLFILGMDFTMLSFDFIPIADIPFVNGFISKFDFDQKNAYYQEIGKFLNRVVFLHTIIKQN